MEQALFDIVHALESTEMLDNKALTKILNKHNKRILAQGGANNSAPQPRPLSKKSLLAFYLNTKRNDPARWARWNFTEEQQRRIMRTLQMKPRRSASGVTTITVLTKPWKCSSACLYCPNDIRMPKSYMANEPACQRAERACFDPYVQVARRLHALEEMGHNTSKIELIVLGGTWSDYPVAYQIWFMCELFRALNDAEAAVVCTSGMTVNDATVEVTPSGTSASAIGIDAPVDTGATPLVDANTNTNEASAATLVNESMSANKTSATTPTNAEAHTDAPAHTIAERIAWYERTGISSNAAVLEQQTANLQARITAGKLTYNQAFTEYYATSTAWQAAAKVQQATWDELKAEHIANQTAQHRVVGLVVETRPEAITIEHLITLRQLGCTKIQMGIQSLNCEIRNANARYTTDAQIARAFELTRLFGFKTHVHAMVNLYGSTPQTDKQDYAQLVTSPAYQPDEIKLYPCVLIGNARLCFHFEQGKWQPYPEETLIDVLVADTLATPAFTRISRMIRDFSAPDIVAGSKKINLRQKVEERIAAMGATPQEIRQREVSLQDVDVTTLTLEVVPYETTVSHERFLQWVTPEGKIAGFLRLSLPHKAAIEQAQHEFYGNGAPDALPCPLHTGEAMIREVHVYGRVAGLATNTATTTHAAQHQGLGTQLVEQACELAREAGYARINVISAIGTRGYYKKLGFYDNGLYQQRTL